MKLKPLNLTDFYKAGHRPQYPKKTEKVYSNGTPRTSRIPEIQSVVAFTFQYLRDEFFIKLFNEEFFQKPKAEVINAYKRRMDNALGPDLIKVDHLEALHDLGYLPIEFKSLPEGTVSPIGVPLFTITNTLSEFFWLTNFLETLISCVTWHGITSATIAFEYRKLLKKYEDLTSDMAGFAQWEGHDFSMRGHTSPESAIVSGAAHLLAFAGSDTVHSIDFLEDYYGADCTKELIGGSVTATEHSVMCLGGAETESQTYERLLDQYPTGILSVVSDTWDYWKVLTVTVPALKDKIMARDGKLVIRPDSGDPVLIVCGDPAAPEGSPERKGTVQLLWETFGGTTNSKGYKQLDTHIGTIYGDSITLDRAEAICSRLAASGFSSTNVVFGIGSYTYQYVTRDTFGFAIKATYGVIDGHPIDMFKNPKTDSGVKKSAKGLLRVNADLTLSQQVTPAEEKEGLLRTIFKDGKAYNTETLAVIRARLLGNLK